MGRSEPGGEKERELARMTTMVIAAGRREGRQANDWRTFNEKTIKQAKTGLFIQNLCETEHPGDYERAGIVILESRRDLGRLYEMAPMRIPVLLERFGKPGVGREFAGGIIARPHRGFVMQIHIWRD